MITVSRFGGNDTEWDNFILLTSINGTFLQTRRFLNYHAEGKFEDCSIEFRKGNELVAAIPACVIQDNGEKIFFAHKGSTYGGISVSPLICNASAIDQLMQALIDYLKQNHFNRVFIRMVPEVYQRSNADLLDYFLY